MSRHDRATRHAVEIEAVAHEAGSSGAGLQRGAVAGEIDEFGR